MSAQYSSSFTEVKHAEFTRAILKPRLRSNEKMYDRLGFCQWEKFVRCRDIVKLADQMASGCGTFASSSPLERDIDYSHWPKLEAVEKVRIGRDAIW